MHSHYEAGEYATLLRGISDTRGSKNFLHEFVYVSLTSHNLTDGKNTLLAPIAAGYDNNSRHASLARLSEVIERFTR